MKAPSSDKVNMSALDKGATSPLCAGAMSDGQYPIDKDGEQRRPWDSGVDKVSWIQNDRVIPTTW